MQQDDFIKNKVSFVELNESSPIRHRTNIDTDVGRERLV